MKGVRTLTRPLSTLSKCWTRRTPVDGFSPSSVVSPHHTSFSCASTRTFRFPRHTRSYGSESGSLSESAGNNTASKPNSIFSSSASAWDHVFSDIQDLPPLDRSVTHKPRRPHAPLPGRSRRQAMTAREISAFDEMFNMIFDAVSGGPGGSSSTTNATTPPSDFNGNIGIGKGQGHGDLNELFGKLRKHSKRMKWTTEEDELLDRKKEAMNLCATDQELLEWARAEVFGESERYEDAARKAIAEAAAGEPSSGSHELPMLQPSTYPHLLAILMRTFRDKFSDPHLALAIFNHARHLSVASYVFGCSTQAYNELIETRWSCLRDLKGVHDALVEMQVNGVEVDSKTRKVVDAIRRDIGSEKLWIDEQQSEDGDVWGVLAKIEALATKPETRQQKRAKTAAAAPKWDEWKTMALEDESDDDWGFNKWDKPKKGREPGWSDVDERRYNTGSNQFGLAF